MTITADLSVRAINLMLASIPGQRATLLIVATCKIDAIRTDSPTIMPNKLHPVAPNARLSFLPALIYKGRINNCRTIYRRFEPAKQPKEISTCNEDKCKMHGRAESDKMAGRIDNRVFFSALIFLRYRTMCKLEIQLSTTSSVCYSLVLFTIVARVCLTWQFVDLTREICGTGPLIEDFIEFAIWLKRVLVFRWTIFWLLLKYRILGYIFTILAEVGKLLNVVLSHVFEHRVCDTVKIEIRFARISLLGLKKLATVRLSINRN